MAIPSLASPIRDGRRVVVDHTRQLRVLGQVTLHAWDRLLWLNCGDGWGPEEAWRRMRKGYMCGLDRSLEQVSRACRLRGIPNNLEFQPWDGHTISSNERSFNHVISCAAVIASPRPAALLREIGRVLVAEGSLSLIEPTPCTPTPARDLLAMLLDAGFVETACLDDGRGWLLANATRRH